MKTVKVKPSHSSQGEFIIIDVDQFDSAIHELVGGEILPTEDLSIDQSAVLIPVEQFDAIAEKLADAESKIIDLQGEFSAFQNDIEAMQARILELQGSQNVLPEKLTVPELKKFLKGINVEFEANSSKEELLALVPKE